MKEHSIILPDEDIRAIIDGRKTQARIVIKPQPATAGLNRAFQGADGVWRFAKPTARHPVSDSDDDRRCPYGNSGDLLWLKEPWQWVEGFAGSGIYVFKLDFITRYGAWERDVPGQGIIRVGKWRPLRQMPKEAARVWLRIEEVRVQRLHDIDEDDAINEGVNIGQRAPFNGNKTCVYCGQGRKAHEGTHALCCPGKSTCYSPNTFRGGYQWRWEQRHGKESWKANPWVWSLTFSVLSTTGKPEL